MVEATDERGPLARGKGFHRDDDARQYVDALRVVTKPRVGRRGGGLSWRRHIRCDSLRYTLIRHVRVNASNAAGSRTIRRREPDEHDLGKVVGQMPVATEPVRRPANQVALGVEVSVNSRRFAASRSRIAPPRLVVPLTRRTGCIGGGTAGF